MDTLDRESLKNVILILQEAEKYGFSSISSPIEVLLETLVDLLLGLASNLEAGQLERKTNKFLKFDDFSQNELGNPRQIRWNKTRVWLEDPVFAETLREIASLLISWQSNHISSTEISSSVTKMTIDPVKPPKIRRPNRQIKQNVKQKMALKKAKNANYYRRLRQKKRTQ